jgi:hypothetical protein
MPYIYADFDWSHCELVGLDFVGLLEEMNEESLALESGAMGASKDDDDDVAPHDMTPKKGHGKAKQAARGGITARGSTASGVGLDGNSGSSTPLWSEYDRSSGMAGEMSSMADERSSSKSKDSSSTTGDSEEDETDSEAESQVDSESDSDSKKAAKKASKKSKSKSKSSKKSKSKGGKSKSKDKKSSKSKKTRARRTLADEFSTLTDKERAQRLRRLKHVSLLHPARVALAAQQEAQ